MARDHPLGAHFKMNPRKGDVTKQLVMKDSDL